MLMGAALSLSSTAAVRDFSRESGLEDSCLGPKGSKTPARQIPPLVKCSLTQILTTCKPSSCQWFIYSLPLSLSRPWTATGKNVPHQQDTVGLEEQQFTKCSSELESFPGEHLSHSNFIPVVLDNLNYWAAIKDLQKVLPHISVHSER